MDVSPKRSWRAPMRALGMTFHVVAACALAYFASAQGVELVSVLLLRCGMARADAVMAAVMLGFVGLCWILLWAFSRRRVLRTWLGLGTWTLIAVFALAVLERLGGQS